MKTDINNACMFENCVNSFKLKPKFGQSLQRLANYNYTFNFKNLPFPETKLLLRLMFTFIINCKFM